MSQILIGLAGYARTGKSTVAEYLAAQLGLAVYAFAQPIKLALATLFGLSTEQLEGAAKADVLPWLGKSPRELMQLLGTEWGRDMVHPQLWLMLAEQHLQALASFHDELPGVVLSDVRFDNEADWVRHKGGVIFHISRPGFHGANGHASECGVRHRPGDYVIDNNGTLAELFAQVDRASAHLMRSKRAA